jgi:hypothetical protein
VETTGGIYFGYAHSNEALRQTNKGGKAFANCPGLAGASIPLGIQHIITLETADTYNLDYEALFENTEIKNIKFCGIGTETSIPKKCCKDCTKLEKVIFTEKNNNDNSDNAYTLGIEAFKGCTSLILNGDDLKPVEVINDWCFEGIKAIKANTSGYFISTNHKIKRIEQGAFAFLTDGFIGNGPEGKPKTFHWDFPEGFETLGTELCLRPKK